MPSRFLLGLILVTALVACTQNLAYSEYRPIQNAKWEATAPVAFEFSQPDSAQAYHMFIHLRNDNAYPFSNLFLIAEFEYPDGNAVKDTLEYKMAEPNGEWLGKGLGSIKENKLWYKENIVFKDSGVYKVTIAHAMRKNGDVEGLGVLDGVTDVGLQIEKITH